MLDAINLIIDAIVSFFEMIWKLLQVVFDFILQIPALLDLMVSFLGDIPSLLGWLPTTIVAGISVTVIIAIIWKILGRT